MKKKSFLQNFHTLPALCRTFGAGECEKAENRWKWGGGSDTMRVIIRNNLSGIASQCHCPGCGTQHPQRFACVLLAAAPTATPCFRHWRRSSLLPLVGEPLAKRESSRFCQGLPSLGATTTTAASGGNRESLLGPRPARRKQSAADAGCRNPGSGIAQR